MRNLEHVAALIACCCAVVGCTAPATPREGSRWELVNGSATSTRAVLELGAADNPSRVGTLRCGDQQVSVQLAHSTEDERTWYQRGVRLGALSLPRQAEAQGGIRLLPGVSVLKAGRYDVSFRQEEGEASVALKRVGEPLPQHLLFMKRVR